MCVTLIPAPDLVRTTTFVISTSTNMLILGSKIYVVAIIRVILLLLTVGLNAQEQDGLSAAWETKEIKF